MEHRVTFYLAKGKEGNRDTVRKNCPGKIEKRDTCTVRKNCPGKTGKKETLSERTVQEKRERETLSGRTVKGAQGEK